MAGEYLRLFALGADRGDCAVIEYGNATEHFGVLVDGGTRGTAERVRAAIDERPLVSWDLLVVTHIDHDHIGGVLELLKDPLMSGKFKDVWFNGRQHLDDDAFETQTVEEGVALEKHLADSGIPWNKAFGGNAVRLLSDGSAVSKPLSIGASATVVSPGLPQLSTLAGWWDTQAALAKERKAAKEESEREAARMAAEPIHDGWEAMALAVGGPDEIRRLADVKPDKDGSAANGSSIAFIFKFHKRSILMTGDAHSDVLFGASSKLPADVQSRVDVMKLPHHGSARNVTIAVLKAFPAGSYVISTDGSHHDHPDNEAIARVVRFNKSAKVYFNYAGRRAQRWLAESKREDNVDAGYKFEVLIAPDARGIGVKVL
jgi:beta-lactamase superfamily II metal-dependent hydrolase